MQDVAAERAVLAGVYRHGEDAYLDVADIVQPDTFSDRANQALYHCMVEMFDNRKMEKLDEASLFSVARDLGYDWLLQGQDSKHVSAILNTQIQKENVRTWGGRIRRIHIANELQNQLNQACNDLENIKGDETFDQILGMAEKRLFDFSQFLTQSTDGEDTPQIIGKGQKAYVEYLESHPVTMVGISSGYPVYDRAIGGGFRRKTVNVIAARTGVGKGQFGVNVSLFNAEKQQIPVLYLDTEMGIEDHWNRTLANRSRVKIDDIETGQFGQNEEHKRRVHEALEKLENIPYHYVNIAGKPFEETLSIIRRWLKRQVGYDSNGSAKTCLIIYDYIKLMTSESIHTNLAEYQILGFQMTGMHNFSVRHDVPILSFIQLNRDGIDRESMDTISGSDRVGWLCSNLTLFKPKTDDEIAIDGGRSNGEHKLVPLKCRHGAGLPRNDYISVRFEGGFSAITEVGLSSNLQRTANQRNNTGFIVDEDISPDLFEQMVVDDVERSDDEPLL